MNIISAFAVPSRLCTNNLASSGWRGPILIFPTLSTSTITMSILSSTSENFICPVLSQARTNNSIGMKRPKRPGTVIKSISSSIGSIFSPSISLFSDDERKSESIKPALRSASPKAVWCTTSFF